MRLMIIILIGAIAIGATYFLTRTQDQQQDQQQQGQQQDQTQAAGMRHTQARATASTSTFTPAAPALVEPNPDLASARIPATTLEQARLAARVAASNTDTKKDPFTAISGAPSDAIRKEPQPHATTASNASSTMVPPPPPGAFPSLPTNLPPPGTIDTLPSGLAVDQLPTPPRSQLISTKIRLTGIMQDRAFFTVTDRIAARANQWPAEFALKVGQDFHGMQLQSINSDNHRVVLAEDGELHTCVMPAIK